MIGEMRIGEDQIGMANLAIAPTADTELYFSLGGYSLQDHVVVPITVSGLERATSKMGIPTKANSLLSETGMDPIEYTFQVVFSTIAEANAFKKLVNSLSEDIIWHGGRESLYQKAKYASVRPAEISDDMFHSLFDVHLMLEDPFLYSTNSYKLSYDNSELPIDINLENAGNAESPIEILVTGRYLNGNFLNGLTANLYNGNVLISSVLLSDRLLSDEILKFTTGDMIQTVYKDQCLSLIQYQRDSYDFYDASFSNHIITIGEAGNGGYLTYKLYGPNPTLDNILLQAKIEDITGLPWIRTSTDNATWYDAVIAVDMAEGYNSYYLMETDRRSDIYVQFYCPVGSKLELSFMRFKVNRSIVPYPAFVIPTEKTYKVEISDNDINSSHFADVELDFAPRYWP